MYNVMLTIFVQINPAVMSATHCFILFTVISIVFSSWTDRKFNCGVALSPSISLAERVRTCNDGLSDCRNVPEEARHIVADFIENRENDKDVTFFNVHQGTIQKSRSFNQLIKEGYTRGQALNGITACHAIDTLYNKRQQGFPKLGRVPGQNSITSGTMESVFESEEFAKLKKSMKDYFRQTSKSSNFGCIISNVIFT